MDQSRINDFVHRAERLERAPWLRTVNGIGTRLIDGLDLPGTSFRISGVWFTFFYVALVPEGFYIVSGNYPKYRFFGKVSFGEISNLVGKNTASRLVVSTYLQSIAIAVVMFLVFFAVAMIFAH